MFDIAYLTTSIQSDLVIVAGMTVTRLVKYVCLSLHVTTILTSDPTSVYSESLSDAVAV